MHEPQRTAARQSPFFASVGSDSGGDCGTGSDSDSDVNDIETLNDPQFNPTLVWSSQRCYLQPWQCNLMRRPSLLQLIRNGSRVKLNRAKRRFRNRKIVEFWGNRQIEWAMEAASLPRAPPAVKAPIHTQHTGQHGNDRLVELIPWSWPRGSHGATTTVMVYPPPFYKLRP